MIESPYIKRIRLEHIRSFKQVSIDLSNSRSPRLLSVIIGRNGTCKSTLLRCIAMALCHKSDSAVLLAEFGGRLVSEGETNALIHLILADGSGKEIGEVRLTIENKNGRDILKDYHTTMPYENIFVCGYGPNRGNTGRSMIREYRALDSVSTLFDYQKSLVDIELMLRRLEDNIGTKRYKRAQKGIKRVLGLTDDHSIRYIKGGGVVISGPGIGENIPWEGWADGYRMTYNWLIDLYSWAMYAKTITETGGIRGVLLVDEIDLNLHPSLQSRLLTQLQQVLPEMQIFSTTHSPLIALGAGAPNVIALHRHNEFVQVQDVPPLDGFSADDALLQFTPGFKIQIPS